MYATGMKIEEWEDGQVNIGIAVCPRPPANIGTGKDTLSSNAKPIVPNSAFVIQPPASHQSQGVSITYAHHVGGISDLIIMLSPQDQGQPDKLSELERLQSRISNMSIEGKAPLNSPVSVQVTGPSPESIEEEKKQSDESGVDEQEKVSGESSGSAKLPQEELHDKETTTSKSGTPSTPHKTSRNSGEMKRVSWVEEAEVFEVSKVRTNSKENKRQSGRKAMGLNGNRSPSKKQNAFTRDTLDGSSVNSVEQRSGDKSRIPVIPVGNGINGDYPTSCEYYRRKMLQELYSAPADNWYGYQSLQRYAGQKVVKKIAAEQKRLEEDISSRRKTEIWILGNDTEDFLMSPPAVPLRKKTTRLKPMQIVH